MKKKLKEEEAQLLDCCQAAINIVKEKEVRPTFDDASDDDIENNTNTSFIFYPKAQTIMKWHRDFRMNRESFPNLCARRSLQEKLPPFFNRNADVAQEFIAHARENLSTLSVETMHNFVHETLIPNLHLHSHCSQLDEPSQFQVCSKKENLLCGWS
mmetsp:Transcript_1842/g.2668  ORF Transcript_1842/g.2668 Transcript_1842/m.2668 type:complete len:156 (+) Transcript_1842:262-729(+)